MYEGRRYFFWGVFTLHVILSHTLGATSSITEPSSVILSHALQRLRRLLSVPLSFFRMRFSDFVDY